ncbi:MAG: hypothetical protein ACUVX8_04490 [Candidatus Zipacnadales bacterium]
MALITRERPFLVVMLEGDHDNFDAALVRGLIQALEGEGLSDLKPSTFFLAAAERLRELVRDPEAGPRLHQVVRELESTSVNEFAERLEAGSLESLSRFDKVHRRVCFGAPWFLETQLSAADTYAEIAEQLVAAQRYTGIW